MIGYRMAVLMVAGITGGTGAVAVPAGQAAAQPATTERVSMDSQGRQGDGGSSASAMSADGRVVAFVSSASNLVAGDSNGSSDTFVHDRVTGTTERVNVDSNGGQAIGESEAFLFPSVSGDGRMVAFVSAASNLVAGDTGHFDVFVHDRGTGSTERVSVDSTGRQGNNISLFPSISGDGRVVAFMSLASNLVAGDTNHRFDVFAHDLITGTTERVSVDSSGGQVRGESWFPSVSSDGQVVAFHSPASNLVVGDTNGRRDVFVRDRAAGSTERVSVDSTGQQADGQSLSPTVSADGRLVAFYSVASNLVSGDTNGVNDVFVHDRVAGSTERVSLDSGGQQPNLSSSDPALSGDGQVVAFHSLASNLVAGDTNAENDVFVYERATGRTERLSVDSASRQADLGSYAPAVSGDGRVVAFSSDATNLVAADTNDRTDVFVRVRATDGLSCGERAVTVTGTAGPDVLTGTAGNDVISGLGGADRIDGKGGDDRICGGAGADVLIGGDGRDLIFGGAGADALLGGSGHDYLFGGPGADSCDGGPWVDRATGCETITSVP